MARTKYTKLLAEKTKAPDDDHDATAGSGTTTSAAAAVAGSSTQTQKMSGSMRNLNLNNPLSLHNDVRVSRPSYVPSVDASWCLVGCDTQNPWHDWFASLELKKTISQDVERTYVFGVVGAPASSCN